MSAGISYYWRLLCTAIGFLIFGLGGLLLGFIVVPCLIAFVHNADKRARLIRLCIHYSFRFFIGMITVLGAASYEVRGREKLEQPGLLLIANHPTLLDVVFLVGFVKNALCIVKHSLFTNPFVGFVIRSANYISNQDPAASIAQCVAALDAGITTIIFPEGTRTTIGGNIRLQRGAAYVAMHSRRPLSPMTISCQPATLSKEEKWYEIPERKMHYIFQMGEDLPTTEHYTAPTPALMARRITDTIRLTLFGNTVNGRA